MVFLIIDKFSIFCKKNAEEFLFPPPLKRMVNNFPYRLALTYCFKNLKQHLVTFVCFCVSRAVPQYIK